MSATRRLYRAAYALDRANRAARNPGRYLRNRAKSKALGAVGFWRAMNRVWRA
ncbi:MAG TPA: hypothetical protein VFA84_05395 [Acidimicrobiales bacterium]|nr:hypothetical protein [Acidimicrobiales bacterium]